MAEQRKNWLNWLKIVVSGVSPSQYLVVTALFSWRTSDSETVSLFCRLCSFGSHLGVHITGVLRRVVVSHCKAAALENLLKSFGKYQDVEQHPLNMGVSQNRGQY